MNTTNQPMVESLITWKRTKHDSRGRRMARTAFRIGRNVLAILGVCFVYLLILGYFQYQDQAAQYEVQCAVSRCM
ncbi:TPA: hypothetical protein ACK3Q6_001638 [Burkholderia cepacia]|uniref:hypothetical protein n=1 Tax=Burkholderia cepacia TaxID=292 RepID=UPI001CF2103C|nr:hypothetical protein [Burkholderia cepacia]MCA8363177.1 hypothetical protein [Burkholderia cepacia]HDR9756485.1 hypothetical protein [Burkholderia cepacia ATCC 25416]HDV6364682.1 hypothetical protein [Burkholderia cepacia]